MLSTLEPPSASVASRFHPDATKASHSEAGTQNRTAASTSRAAKTACGASCALPTHPALPGDVVKQATALFDSSKAEHAVCMTLAELRGVLQDAGYEYNANEVKDLVFQVQQSQGILKRNQQTDQQQLHGDVPRVAVGTASVADTTLGAPRRTPERTKSAVSAMSAVSHADTRTQRGGAAAEDAAAAAVVDFTTFLEILTLNLTDSNPEPEYRAVWEVLDADGDGLLSADDLALALADLKLPPLSRAELAGALEQADYDCDGRVTLSDFLSTMDTT